MFERIADTWTYADRLFEGLDQTTLGWLRCPLGPVDASALPCGGVDGVISGGWCGARGQGHHGVGESLFGGEQMVSAPEPWCRVRHPTDFKDALLAVAALARGRGGTLEEVPGAACGVPGLERVMGRPELGFAGMLAGVG